MNNTQKLNQFMQDNPDREVIFMYPEEGSDHYYTLGKPSKVELDEFVVTDEKVWFKSDEDSLREDVADIVADDLFSYKDFPLSEEQEKQVDIKADEIIGKMEWKEAIVVYIQPK